MAKKKVLKAKSKAKAPKKVAKAAKKPALKVVAKKANGNGKEAVGTPCSLEAFWSSMKSRWLMSLTCAPSSVPLKRLKRKRS